MRLLDNGDNVVIWASQRDTYNWAHRSGASWPCSTLSDKRFVAAFDTDGLVEFTVNGSDSNLYEVDSAELSAICADLVGTKIDSTHPCWFVVVGQFQEKQAQAAIEKASQMLLNPLSLG